MAMGGKRVKEVQTSDHIDAGGHHRGGVDQGGDRRRAGHGVRKPDIQRKLGGLTRCSEEQQEADRRGDQEEIAFEFLQHFESQQPVRVV
jgi:hypothetical protein